MTFVTRLSSFRATERSWLFTRSASPEEKVSMDVEKKAVQVTDRAKALKEFSEVGKA